MDGQQSKHGVDYKQLKPVDGNLSAHLNIDGVRATAINFDNFYFARGDDYFFLRASPQGDDSPRNELILRGDVTLELLRVYQITSTGGEGKVEAGFAMEGFSAYPHEDITQGQMKVMQLIEHDGQLHLSLEFNFHFKELSGSVPREMGVWGNEWKITAVI